jgi:hypothetical protein
MLAESWQDETGAWRRGLFLQVNRLAAALLEEHVLALAGDVRAARRGRILRRGAARAAARGRVRV